MPKKRMNKWKMKRGEEEKKTKEEFSLSNTIQQ
jgi:hypothetical protein